jgi:hypothetical protein
MNHSKYFPIVICKIHNKVLSYAYFLIIQVYTLSYCYHLILLIYCCDVAVAQINYPSFKHNTQDSIEQARGRSHEEDSSQIFMLDDMQFRGGLDVI